jgi:hypothetical protein
VDDDVITEVTQRGPNGETIGLIEALLTLNSACASVVREASCDEGDLRLFAAFGSGPADQQGHGFALPEAPASTGPAPGVARMRSEGFVACAVLDMGATLLLGVCSGMSEAPEGYPDAPSHARSPDPPGCL